MINIKDLNFNTLEDYLRLLFSYYDTNFDEYQSRILPFYKDRIEKGAKGKICYDGENPAGIVQYEPMEIALQPVNGKSVFFMDFILVLPEYRKKGYGFELLAAVLKELKRRKGIATYASDYQEWMPGTFFDKYNFVEKDRIGSLSMIYRKIKKEVSLEFLKPELEIENDPDILTIDFFQSFSLPVWLDIEKLLNEISEKSKDRIIVRFYDCTSRKKILKIGAASGIYFNGENPFDLPPSLKEVKEEIENRIAL